MAASTPFTSLYGPMRAVLGDREVHGSWMYDTDSLSSALRAVMITGGGPAGYTLDGADPYTAVAVTPEVKLGDDAALLIFDSCLLLIGGEDGALSYQTRSLSVRDGGDRKRELLSSLELKVYAIRHGSAVFASFQSLMQWIIAQPRDGGGPWDGILQLGSITVNPVSDVVI